MDNKGTYVIYVRTLNDESSCNYLIILKKDKSYEKKFTNNDSVWGA